MGTRTVRVEVTAEDIAAGQAGKCYRCPIALAANRAFAQRQCYVDDRDVGYDDGFYRNYAPMPAEAVAFVRDIDNGRPVKPFAFTLELP